MNHPYRIARWCFPAGTALIGWWAGTMSPLPRAVPHNSMAQEGDDHVVIASVNPSDGVQNQRVMSSASRGKLPQGLAEALSPPSRLRRQLALRRYFESLDVSQLPEIFAQVMSERSLRHDDAAIELFRVWIRRDVTTAALHVAELAPSTDRYYIQRNFVSLWAKRDATAAKAWASTISVPGAGSRNPLLSYLNPTVIGPASTNRVEIDSRGAFEKYITINKAQLDPQVRGIVVSAARGVAEKDLELVRRAAAAAEDPEERRVLSSAVAVQLASTDPDSVAAYLETLPLADRRQALEVYGIWAEHDPSKALAFFQKDLPEEVSNNSFSLSQAVRSMVAPAAVKDPAAVAAAVSELNAPARAEVLYDVGQIWCRTDGAAAAAWAAALPPGPARDESLRQFVAAWAVHDSLQVTAFINALPPGSGKSAAAEGFARTTFDLDPDASLAWIRTIPDRQEQLRALQETWTVWSRTSLSSAYQWRDKAPGLSPEERSLLSGNYMLPQERAAFGNP